MPSTIMWMSQHTPTLRQKEELERLFPGHILLVDPRPFDGVDDILARYKLAQADEMVVVAPLTVMRALVRQGLHPIYAEMRSCSPKSPLAEVYVGQRAYHFVAFHRVDAVTLKLTKLEPKKEGG